MATYSSAMGITTSYHEISFGNGGSSFTISANPSGKTLVDPIAIVAAGDGIGGDPVTVTWDLQYFDLNDSVWRSFLNIGAVTSNTNPLTVFRLGANAGFNGSGYNENPSATPASAQVGTVKVLPGTRIFISVSSSGSNGRISYNKTIIA